MRRRALTPRQKAYLEAVRVLAPTLPQAPTAADVARHLGITRKGARQPLLALIRKGYLTDVPVVIRAGYALTPTGEAETSGGIVCWQPGCDGQALAGSDYCASHQD